MNKYMIVLVGLLLAGLTQAQKPAMVECRIGDGIGNKIQLFRVENGRKVSMVNAGYHQNGYYGFKFIPEYEGFYVIGDDRNYQYPLYLKEGDEIALYMDKDTVFLTGKRNTLENKVLYQWINLSKNVEAKSIRFYRVRSDYRDFFPEFETFSVIADQFKAELKTKNMRFNELMRRSIDFEKDYYAITMLYTPRSVHPKKEERIAYYGRIVQADKFDDNVILLMPYGMDLVNRYTMFATFEQGKPGRLENCLPLIGNPQVKNVMILDNAVGIKTYFEYQRFAENYSKYLDGKQKQALEAIGSQLYETRKGMVAADFTYPDANGKMVSLSDFKGKVVLVDVWATWCGPCRGELPHLKKLEEKMKGKDVVFIGVSLDEEKNREKWKKFIIDEQLPGIQLFADGWSKIAKDYKITGIPRFMVFDREGKVVEATAPRPSDPNLEALLEEVLKLE